MNMKSIFRGSIVIAAYMGCVILLKMGLYTLNLPYLSAEILDTTVIMIPALVLCSTKKVKNYISSVA